MHHTHPPVAPRSQRLQVPRASHSAAGFSFSRALGQGTLAAATSQVALMLRGRRETGHAAAPVNAISHWVWPRQALRADAPTLRHTLTGTAIHWGSSLLWGAAYSWLRGRRAHPTAANAVVDAAAVTAVAALVDLRIVPHRLSPGFQDRLSGRALVQVYGGFALGLVLTAWLGGRR